MTGNPMRGEQFVRSLIPVVTIVFTVGLDQLATAALLQYLVPAVADLTLPLSLFLPDFSLPGFGLPGLDLLRFPLPLPVL